MPIFSETHSTDCIIAAPKRYEQRYVLLFAILATVTGADLYRGIRTFIAPGAPEQSVWPALEAAVGAYLVTHDHLRS